MILALDVGTSSARAALYDESGVPVPRRLHRVAYEPTITADGGVEHDPNVVLAAVATCLDAVLTGPGLPAVAGVGVATFWHGLLGFDATGHAVTPIYMWADTRSAREATLLAGALDEAGLHARTGCYIHTSYGPAKLRWLARERPAELQRVTRWGSIGEHLEHAFFGEAATSVSIASATGLFDHARLHWDPTALAAGGIETAQLFPLVDRHEPRRDLRSAWARRWPALLGGAHRGGAEIDARASPAWDWTRRPRTSCGRCSKPSPCASGSSTSCWGRVSLAITWSWPPAAASLTLGRGPRSSPTFSTG